jgi:hypothetical protein
MSAQQPRNEDFRESSRDCGSGSIISSRHAAATDQCRQPITPDEEMSMDIPRMKRLLAACGSALLMFAGGTVTGDSRIAPAPNGLTLPEDYRDWRLIASSHRTDNSTLRVILGNEIAIEAARAGHTNPWPDGTVLAKLVWKDAIHPAWEKAVIPGDFVHAEFMFKDAKRWAATGGWGFARWKGMEQIPYGKDAGFVQECFGCHTPVKDNDYVFTHPAALP